MPFIEINENSRNNLNDLFDTDCIFFYYWNNCGHCLQFKPIFYDVIRELMENRPTFMRKTKIFQIELNKMDLLPNEFQNVNAFPSVIAYSNGNITGEFKDQRTKTNLNKFILSSMGESSKSYNGTSSSQKIKKITKKYPKSV
jgi:hypothetical protein